MQKKQITKRGLRVATRSEIAQDFGKWVKDKRQDAKLTQNEVALRADMSRPYLARIEAGEIPGRSLILRLAHALGASEREALTRAGFGTGLEKEEIPLSMITYKLLSPRSQAIIDHSIEELHKLEESHRKQR